MMDPHCLGEALLGSAIDMPESVGGLLREFAPRGAQELIWSTATLAVAIALGVVAGWVGLLALRRWARRTTTDLDDSVVRWLAPPLRWLAPVAAVKVSLPLVALAPAGATFVHHLTLVLLILGSGWLLLRGLGLAEQLVEQRFDVAAADNRYARSVHTQVRVFRNISGFIVITATLAFALMTFDAVRQVGTGLLASAGAAGVIVGFAAQRSIATLLAGIQIALTQPIRVDDVVIVDGNWGRIEEITLTYVVVRIWDERRLIVPVTQFLEKSFENWTRSSAELLGVVELKLDYRVPIDPIRKELERIVKSTPHWDGRVQGVAVTEASDRTITVRPLVSAADSGALWDLRCEVREKLIAFVCAHYPWALPRARVVVDEPDAQSRAEA